MDWGELRIWNLLVNLHAVVIPGCGLVSKFLDFLQESQVWWNSRQNKRFADCAALRTGVIVKWQLQQVCFFG